MQIHLLVFEATKIDTVASEKWGRSPSEVDFSAILNSLKRRAKSRTSFEDSIVSLNEAERWVCSSRHNNFKGIRNSLTTTSGINIKHGNY